MKKKILSVFFIVLAVSLVFTAFIGCQDPLNAVEKEIVGKYQLIDIDVEGSPNVSADSYIEYTIEFKADRKCVIVRRSENTDENYYTDNAEWKSTTRGEIEITIKEGRAKAYERYEYALGFISGTNSFVDANNNPIDVFSLFQRIAETD